MSLRCVCTVAKAGGGRRAEAVADATKLLLLSFSALGTANHARRRLSNAKGSQTFGQPKSIFRSPDWSSWYIFSHHKYVLQPVKGAAGYRYRYYIVTDRASRRNS